MLRIHTSQRTEVLLDALARAVAGERERGSPFSPARIVVPNRNVETYLRLGLAERLGIAANLEMTYLRKLLAELAERAVPGARVAGASVIEGHLLALLHDERLLGGDELATVRAYLFAAGPEPDAVDRRRAQLAAQLAPLFDEYAGSRAEMLARWRDGASRTTSEMEAWQRALWRAVFGPGGRLERQTKEDGGRWLALEALWDEAMRASPPPLGGETLHVFGLSYIARGYHRMLAALARVADVHVYTLNPCRETLTEPLEAATHLALNLWGRPGRENLRLLAGIESAIIEQDFPDQPAATLLGRLQTGIVSGRAPLAATASELDGSLRVLPCPSLRRELEVVAAEIWGLLRADPTLRACDVAVIVPEKSRQGYLAQLPAVFAESCGLPHNLADVPVQGSHPVAEAIAALIELPFSGLSRKDLLPLLTHPCVRARFPAATVADWRALADTLGIVRGADRGDFDPAYLRRDLYSWDQGLGRLALGAVADQGQPESDPTFLLGGEPYLAGPAIETDDEAALGFGLLARSLVADARFARQESGPRPIGEWAEFLRRMVASYLVLDDEDGAGQALVGAFLASIDHLADHALGQLPVSYRIAAELAKRALGELPWSRGRYLASGVTVASFVPMRAIPFRAVFVLGLGQDAFPRPHGRHELDLRGDRVGSSRAWLGADQRGRVWEPSQGSHPQRLPGDVDRREQDLYMFLETLLQAREHLTLSYVSRDELTGDELPASPALLELRAVLEQGYLDEDGLAQVFGDRPADRPPLRRYDDREERRQVLPAAEAEHRAKQLGLALGGAGEAASVSRRVAGLPAGLRAQVANVLGLPSPAEGGGPAWPAAIKIPLYLLRCFLEDPLQASARFALGMADEEGDDSAGVEDEPFDVDRLLWSSLLRETMTAALVEAQGTPPWPAVAATHARRALDAELAGRAPSGMFRAPAAAKQEEVLRGWREGLREILGEGAVACRRFRFVPDLDGAPAMETLPRRARIHCRAPTFAIQLPAGGGREAATIAVTLVGETGLWAGGARAHALHFTTRQSIEPALLGKEDLAAFVDHVALTAAGEATSPGFGSAVFHAVKGVPGQRVRGFGRLTAAAARAYLAGLCTALLRGVGDGSPASVHPYLLPHEAVLRSHHGGTPLAEEIERLCAGDERGAGFSSAFGPIRCAGERFAAPPAAVAQAMVAERFGLFFELAREDGA